MAAWSNTGSSRATLRLYDGNHDSVYSQRLCRHRLQHFRHRAAGAGAGALSCASVSKTRCARLQPTASSGYLRIREVEAYGRPAEQAGILSFSASPAEITAGQSAQLQWQTDSVQELRIYPSIGSVGAFTGTDGSGQITVSPACHHRIPAGWRHADRGLRPACHRPGERPAIAAAHQRVRGQQPVLVARRLQGCAGLDRNPQPEWRAARHIRLLPE